MSILKLADHQFESIIEEDCFFGYAQVRVAFREDASEPREKLADCGFEFRFRELAIGGNGLLDCAGWVGVEDCPNRG